MSPFSFRDLPVGARGRKLLAAGLGTILVGYVFLRIPPVDGFLSLTLAPLLLVAGYCVLIPAGLLVGEPQAPAQARDGSGR